MQIFSITQISSSGKNKHIGVVKADSEREAIIKWSQANRDCGLPEPSGQLNAKIKHTYLMGRYVGPPKYLHD